MNKKIIYPKKIVAKIKLNAFANILFNSLIVSDEKQEQRKKKMIQIIAI